MTTSTLSGVSEAIADVVAAVAPSVVQVQGRRRPASGIVYAEDVVLTTAAVLGREERLHLRTGDGRTFDAELAGLDPATGLVVLRASGLGTAPATPSNTTVRVGNLVIAAGRSWSNAISASMGIVAVIGGPLRTGRRRSIEQVIRTTVPIHEGFAGGPLVDPEGRVVGVSTGAAIRGFEVAIPSSIAWSTAEDVLTHGRPRRGFLGLAGQTVAIPERLRGEDGQQQALLIVGVTPGSPADDAGLIVGDVLLQFDGRSVSSPDDLLEQLTADRIGRAASSTLLRGGQRIVVSVTPAEAR
jgi:S1-C subfamily serine protease